MKRNKSAYKNISIVGLAMLVCSAVEFSKKFNVIGYDISERRIFELKKIKIQHCSFKGRIKSFYKIYIKQS